MSPAESDATWVDVADGIDIGIRSARRIALAGQPVAIFRTHDGCLFAVLDRCPHKGGPLSDGIVHGRAVACPLHNWSISLETGQALGEDKGCVRTFPVRERDGRIHIDASQLIADAV